MKLGRRIPLILASASVITGLLTGCLEFERQTLTFRHDAASDTLLIFQDYQGIFGADDSTRLSENEVEQMASVMKEERTFFFGNWITEFSRRQLEDQLQKPVGEIDDDPAAEQAIRALGRLALDNVKVQNVGFYLNADRKLCGAQRVTIRNVSKLLPALNQVVRLLARIEADKDDKVFEEKRRLRRFAENGPAAITLEGNRLVLRWPVSEEEFLRFRDQTPQGKGFRQSGGEIQRENEIMVMTIGQPDAKTTAWSMPVSEFPYAGNGLEQAKAFGVKETFDAAGAAQAFLLGSGAPKSR